MLPLTNLFKAPGFKDANAAKISQLITMEESQRILRWSVEIAHYHWLVSNCSKVYRGDVAGCATYISNKCYWVLTIKNRIYNEHILRWFELTGAWPSGDLHHIDGNGLNNSFLNLIDLTSQQHKFIHRKILNLKRFVGVFWHSPNKKWYARARLNGSEHFLGYFHREERAAEVYDAWVIENHTEGFSIKEPFLNFKPEIWQHLIPSTPQHPPKNRAN